MWVAIEDLLYKAIRDLTAALVEGLVPYLREPLNDSLDALFWLTRNEADDRGSIRVAIVAIKSICDDLEFDATVAAGSGNSELAACLDNIVSSLRAI